MLLKYKMQVINFSILLCCLVFIGCSSRITNHGKYWLDEDLATIKVAKSTKADIIRIIGQPSIMDKNFPHHIIYIHHKNSAKAFLKPKIFEYKALEFIMNPKTGKLQKVVKYSIDDLNKVKIHSQSDVLSQGVGKIINHHIQDNI